MKLSTKSFEFYAIISAFLFSCMLLQGQNISTKDGKIGIFIGEMKVLSSVTDAAKQNNKELSLKRVTQALDSQLVSALSATGVFKIVERKRKSDVELEQGYASVAVNPGDKDAAKMGKMAGAKYAFLPQVDGFEELVDKQEYNATERVSVRHRLFLSVSVSIVDTTTGELLPDVATVQLTQDGVIQNARRSDQCAVSSQTIVELAKKVAEQLCQEAIEFLCPAKVLAVTGTQILINRGVPDGFSKGAKLTIFAFTEVKDEAYGEVYRNEVQVGRGIITRSDHKKSFAELEGDNLGVAKGCIVKLDKLASVSESLPQSAPGGAFPQDPDGIRNDSSSVTPGSSEKPIEFN
jgi:curli biogenesis system outer membrane secretion channel CsgG